MIIKHYYEVFTEVPSLEGTKGCTRRWLIAEKDGAKNYAMRIFELQPNGVIPLHTHNDMEHEIFVTEGEGILKDGKREIPIKKGDAIFILPNEQHSFINKTTQPLKFICVIPILH